MMNLYNTIDKYSRMILSIVGLITFTAIMVIGSYEGHGWPAVVIGLIGIMSFGRMLRNTLKKYYNVEGS